MLVDFFNEERVLGGGHGLEMAAAAIEETWEFVHDREAFGKQIADFQAVQHELADMRIDFESARALNWRAVDKAVAGENTILWGAAREDQITETAVSCAERGMQLHGGRSVLTDLEHAVSDVFNRFVEQTALRGLFDLTFRIDSTDVRAMPADPDASNNYDSTARPPEKRLASLS